MSNKIKIDPVNLGKRPVFFDDPATDQLIAIIMAMSAELSVLYDRVDTIERLLDKKGTLERNEIEKFRPDQKVEDQRNERRNEYISRIFRIIQEERMNLTPHDKMDEYKNLMEEISTPEKE